MAENTIKTRIQLKNDTEAHWNLATNFIPREGEIIVYSADGSHPFSRFKVGDGKTNVVNLPFVDSGSINGIAFFESFSEFPSIGSEEVLYPSVSRGYAGAGFRAPAEGVRRQVRFRGGEGGVSPAQVPADRALRGVDRRPVRYPPLWARLLDSRSGRGA